MEAPLHLVFAAGPAHYALPAPLASEIVTAPRLVSVPGMAPHIAGIFAHRGELVPVLDLSRLLDGAEAGGGSARGSRAVLARTREGLLGFIAGDVLGVLPVSGSPAALATSGLYRHLQAPASAPQGDVTIIEAQGLWDYLSRRH